MRDLQQVKHSVLSMAFTRDHWITTVRNRLMGPLREYAKEKLVSLVPIQYSWDKEIRQLVKKVAELFDPKITRLKTKFDVSKAFVEAVNEASGEQVKVQEAIDIFINKYLVGKSGTEILEFEKKASELELDAGELIIELLDKYAPELLDILQKGLQ